MLQLRSVMLTVAGSMLKPAASVLRCVAAFALHALPERCPPSCRRLPLPEQGMLNHWVAMRWDAMGCDGMRWDAMGCDGMRCGAMRCDAMRCDAMRCDPILPRVWLIRAMLG